MFMFTMIIELLVCEGLTKNTFELCSHANVKEKPLSPSKIYGTEVSILGAYLKIKA